MTDYLEEQQNEIEALESIYPDEFQAISEKEFKISIYPDEQDEDHPRAISLQVKYTPTYPDELPEYDIKTLEGQIPTSYYTKMKDAVKEAAEESVGMAMIFTMVSIIKEELDNIMLDVQRAEEEIINENRRKQEEAEQAKFTGTKVTVENFMAWKKTFDEEMLKKDAVLRAQKEKELKGKLTGRQLFEQDKSLAMSDAKYMDADDVSVDASLFDKEERGGALEPEDDENAVWKQFDKEE
ncbi:ubiquitin-conjugating enzyme/RWD-like protein [Mucor mucedo]|uniref:ubiquitin-conjugating enzyme/RWD-like protein n=1 Tax=Mucor mucedo TaxID=29922 RepID=UPI00221FDC40|nr:ubiquitin-conjugating enzyme/RWD-like protein [Mucor mucedo]KAI7894210.1 ubiquitin-conjugating enzyme/RWD-like protein [Mucor mucedo]